MTPEEINAALALADETERLAQAATEGPWERFNYIGRGELLRVRRSKPPLLSVAKCDKPLDASFITHARNNAEQIVADVRRLAGQLAMAERHLRWGNSYAAYLEELNIGKLDSCKPSP